MFLGVPSKIFEKGSSFSTAKVNSDVEMKAEIVKAWDFLGAILFELFCWNPFRMFFFGGVLIFALI